MFVVSDCLACLVATFSLLSESVHLSSGYRLSVRTTFQKETSEVELMMLIRIRPVGKTLSGNTLLKRVSFSPCTREAGQHRHMGLLVPHRKITQCHLCAADKVLLTSFWIKNTEVSIWLSAMGTSELCQMSSVA